MKVSLATICGSDIHTVTGRRKAPGPIILGHEICGRISALGGQGALDFEGRPLRVGDRVTWSIMASCGECYFCKHEIPQKCESLFKYGHESITNRPALSGGFAEYIYLRPGTSIFHVPDGLTDEVVTPANCSLSTMCAAVRMMDVREGESVLIQGAGLLGLCAAALCACRGARIVAVADVLDKRLERAKEFGSTHVVNMHGEDGEDALQDAAPSRGFDVGIEVCGVAEAIPTGLAALRVGGRYLTAGCVYPGAEAMVDFQLVTRGMRQIVGLHNYTPPDLAAAVGFLSETRDRFPWDGIIGATYDLGKINQAVCFAQSSPEIIRVGVRGRQAK